MTKEVSDSTPEGALPRTLAVLRDGLARGWHSGAQLYVSLRGRPVADLALGEARPGRPMEPDTIMLWLSSGKPVGAVAVAQLWERGRLELDDPVCCFVPEFGAAGKDRVTLRHLLTHTAGIPFVEVRRREASWDEIIASICAAPLEPGWEPGLKAGYHPASAWFMLAAATNHRPATVIPCTDSSLPPSRTECRERPTTTDGSAH